MSTLLVSLHICITISSVDVRIARTLDSIKKGNGKKLLILPDKENV